MKKQTECTYEVLSNEQKLIVDRKLIGFGIKKSFKNYLKVLFGKELRNGQKELISIKTPKGTILFSNTTL